MKLKITACSAVSQRRFGQNQADLCVNDAPKNIHIEKNHESRSARGSDPCVADFYVELKKSKKSYESRRIKNHGLLEDGKWSK